MNAPDTARGTSATSERVRVWDAPTRVFHWCIALLVMTSWYTADAGHLEWHRRSGLALLALLLFRIAWGIVGSTTARFSDFVRHPRVVVQYLKAMGSKRKAIYAGHNPAGGWMVVTFLSILLGQAATGLFANDGLHFKAPFALWVNEQLSDRLTEIHALGFNVILVLIWMHLVAVFYYWLVAGENLVAPMFTGTKQAMHVPRDVKLAFGRSTVALIVLAAAAGIVVLIAN